MENKAVGMIGEQVAAEYLSRNGYRILSRNYFTRWGELDIICSKADSLIFVEVKTRIGLLHGKPHEAVTQGKLLRLLRAIQYYVKGKSLNMKYRLHIISITLDATKKVTEMQHYQDIELPNVYKF